jgi:hypothetical protein
MVCDAACQSFDLSSLQKSSPLERFEECLIPNLWLDGTVATPVFLDAVRIQAGKNSSQS